VKEGLSARTHSAPLTAEPLAAFPGWMFRLLNQAAVRPTAWFARVAESGGTRCHDHEQEQEGQELNPSLSHAYLLPSAFRQPRTVQETLVMPKTYVGHLYIRVTLARADLGRAYGQSPAGARCEKERDGTAPAQNPGSEPSEWFPGRVAWKSEAE
jgi:hypothetical protein